MMLQRTLRRTSLPLVSVTRRGLLRIPASTTSQWQGNHRQRQMDPDGSTWLATAQIFVAASLLSGYATMETRCDSKTIEKSRWSTLFGLGHQLSSTPSTKENSKAAELIEAIVPPQDGVDPSEISTVEPATKPKDDILSDDESECFVCKVYRQGPCRPTWIPLERCVQEKGNNNHSAVASCQKEFYEAFETCWKERTDLYKLIALDVHQRDQVRVLEMAPPGSDVQKKTITIKPGLPLQADWGDCLKEIQRIAGGGANWQDLVQRGTSWTSLDKSVPLWKRFEILNEKPRVATVTIRVPTKHEGGTLTAAYAVDQDNMVLGFKQSPEAGPEGDAPSDTSRSQLSVSLLPGMTETVRIRALYTSTYYDDGEKKERTQLYQAESISLKDTLVATK